MLLKWMTKPWSTAGLKLIPITVLSCRGDFLRWYCLLGSSLKMAVSEMSKDLSCTLPRLLIWEEEGVEEGRGGKVRMEVTEFEEGEGRFEKRKGGSKFRVLFALLNVNAVACTCFPHDTTGSKEE